MTLLHGFLFAMALGLISIVNIANGESTNGLDGFLYYICFMPYYLAMHSLKLSVSIFNAGAS